MSTNISGLDGSDVIVTRYFGGQDRGTSYQINDDGGLAVSLTTRQAERVAKAILADIKKRRKEARGGK